VGWGFLKKSSQLWRNPVKFIIIQHSQEPSSAALELLVKLIGRVGDWSRLNTAGNPIKFTQLSQYCQGYKQQAFKMATRRVLLYRESVPTGRLH